jgi:poly-gamma-glutamate synthesis protein (capsule biosynthesis protein)
VINKEVIISFTGDIFPGELTFTRGYGFRTQLQNKDRNFDTILTEIFPKSNHIICNLESPLINRENRLKDTFFGDPLFSDFLLKNKIRLVNLANNHILEHGKEGLLSTVKILKDHGISCIGCDDSVLKNIHYILEENIKIGLSGFSCVDLDKINNCNDFAELNELDIIDKIEEMKRNNANVIIISLHWGNEYIQIPSLRQREIAYRLIDNGADIIIGHHPHVVQPYEQYKKGHIFYSLGNFIFDYIHSKKVSIGLVVDLVFSEGKSFSINTRGVKLSYKNVVETIPLEKFTNYFAQINQSFDKVKDYNTSEYHKRYLKILKFMHLKERIMMKLALFHELLVVKIYDKKILIRNVLNYYFNIKRNL